MLKGILLTSLVVAIAVAILFRVGVLEVELDPAPVATLRNPAPISNPAPTPTATPSLALRQPDATPNSPPTEPESPKLTIQQIFQKLAQGKLTEDEAKGMLGEGTNPNGTEGVLPSGAAPTSTPVPTPTPAAATATPERGSPEWIKELEFRVHDLTNGARLERGLAALSFDNQLADIGRGHSQDMMVNNFFAHENLQGDSPSDRAEEAGYDCTKYYETHYTTGIGENIFQGWLYSQVYYQNGAVVDKDYMSLEQLAERVVTGWMNSPGHRKNILTDTYDKEGIGVSIGPDEKVYVTQNFC